MVHFLLMMNLSLKKLITAAGLFLFSDLCFFCRIRQQKDNKLLCDECYNRLKFIKEPCCFICGRPFINPNDISHTCGECIKTSRNFDSSRSIFVYESILKNNIISYKFMRDITLANVFAGFMQSYIASELENAYDIIIPVPLHKKRLRERYFNQALLIVNGVPKNNQIKVDKYSLKRIKYTSPQVFLRGEERQKNVKGAFEVSNTEAVTGKRILVVDDIYTTGSTVNECSKVLKKAGALSVNVLTLAKTNYSAR